MGDPYGQNSKDSDAEPPGEPPEFARLLTEDDGDATAPPTVIRDIEKSLVERIADVDDERRRTSTQVRKALGVHRDEVEQRLRTYRGLLMATLAGLALVAGVLIWLLVVWSGERARLGQQIADLAQRTPVPAAAIVADDAQALESEIAELRRRAQAISNEVQALQQGQTASEQRLQQQLATLADRLEAQPVDTGMPARDGRQAQELAAIEQRVDAVAGQLASIIAATQRSPEQAMQMQPTSDEVRRDQLRPSGLESQQPSEATDESSDQMILAEPRVALQLVGYHDREAVQQFIATHRLPREVYLRSESYRGRPWYALIYDLYANAEAADGARSSLPEDLTRLDIWLRELPAGTSLERLSTRTTD